MAGQRERDFQVELGPRPFYLIDQMSESPLEEKLESCREGPFRATDFSIGHRGAPLQFPEHTKEGYEAAVRMGAGLVECDVTFTADLELVCRHAQCDLHTTTNILATPLAAKCSRGFSPAVFDAGGRLVEAASALCCTSDLTLAEFKTLQGKMDAADGSATTIEAYLSGTPRYRTDLYASGGTLMTHAESIELFKGLGVGMIPELKSPEVPMPFRGSYTRQDYAQQMIDEYRAAGVPPARVRPQSFDLQDVLYWVNHEPEFGSRAVFLDERYAGGGSPSEAEFEELKAKGVNIVAPPMSALLTAEKGTIEPSLYARRARRAGLDIISWTTERSGRISEDVLEGGTAYYYQTTLDALENDGDILKTIDVLAREVGIIGLFSDWPATTTYYASCFDLD
jgi:glycerophosphoryl diester phosphodiesterase